MEWSEILNIVFGTGLVATIVGLLSIRSELKKARAEAEKAMADADTVKITNTENATRILIENIVDPLKEELNETRKELNPIKRELARLRKAVEAIQLCPYRGECPVLAELQDDGGVGGRKEGQYQNHIVGPDRKRKRRRGGPSGHSGVDGADPGPDRQSASGCSVQCADRPGYGTAEEAGGRRVGAECSGHHPGESDDPDDGPE